MNQAWKNAGYLPEHWPFRGHDGEAVHRSDFAATSDLPDRPTPDETSAKVREVVSVLKGACLAVALLPFLAFCRTVGPGEIPPDSKMGEIHPDTLVTNLVAQAGGGGGGMTDDAMVFKAEYIGENPIRTKNGDVLTPTDMGLLGNSKGFIKTTDPDTYTPASIKIYNDDRLSHGLNITPSMLSFTDGDGNNVTFHGMLLYGILSDGSYFEYHVKTNASGFFAVESWSSLRTMLVDANTNQTADCECIRTNMCNLVHSNIVETVNTTKSRFYDAGLGVEWTFVPMDGEFMFIATTNVNREVIE